MSQKKDQILHALSELYSDTNMAPSETLKELEEICEETQMRIVALRESIGEQLPE